MHASKILGAALVLLGCCSAANAPAKKAKKSECSQGELSQCSAYTGEVFKSCKPSKSFGPPLCEFDCINGYQKIKDDSCRKGAVCVADALVCKKPKGKGKDKHMKGGRSGQPSYCDAAQGFVSCDGGTCQCPEYLARYEKDGTVSCVDPALKCDNGSVCDPSAFAECVSNECKTSSDSGPGNPPLTCVNGVCTCPDGFFVAIDNDGVPQQFCSLQCGEFTTADGVARPFFCGGVECDQATKTCSCQGGEVPFLPCTTKDIVFNYVTGTCDYEDTGVADCPV